MECVEKFVVTGFNQGKFVLMKIELCKEDIIKQEMPINIMDKIAIHSILNSGNIIYLADSFTNKIFKYDLELNDLSEVTVGRDPRHICLNNENIYVTNFESDNISIIDIQNFTLTGSLPAGIKPHDIKCCGNMLYISCYEENVITQYNLENGEKKYFNTDGKPMHIFLTDNSIITMTYFVNGNIYTKINFINKFSKDIEGILKIEGLSTDVDFDDKNNLLYLINIIDKYLYVIDIANKNVIKKIFLGGYPESLSYSKNYIFVTNSKKGQIAIIDKKTLSVIKNIDLDFIPDCIKIIS